MGKVKRILLDNSIYHITVRGNQKQTTFINADDFTKYEEILKYYKKKYKFNLYGYCLMPNHVHLILEITEARRLAKIMQGLNLTYTLYFNKKYQKVGHLWQGRYKSKIIQKDKYLINCIEYIELNPLRNNLVSTPFEYPWSSWKERLGYKKKILLDELPII